MKCRILHESSCRMRVHVCQSRMTLGQADMLEYYLRSRKFISDVKVFDRTGDALISFKRDCRSKVISALARFSYDDENTRKLVPERTSRQLDRDFENELFWTVTKRYAEKLLLPAPVRFVISAVKSLKFIWEALKAIARGKIEVAILDATAITVSLLRRDQKTASSVMFLLKIGELLEEWTHKKSVNAQ